MATTAPPPETRFGLTPGEWRVAGAALGLHALSNGVLPSRYQVPAGLVAGAALSALAAHAGAGLEAQGLRPRDLPQGVAYGLAAGGGVASLVLAGAATQHSRSLYGHEDVAVMTPLQLLYECLVRIPLATALPEEVVFRGALPPLLSRRHRPIAATGATAVLFGLWHITPTWRRLGTHRLFAGRRRAHQAGWVLATVGATTGAGMLLSLLRFRSRSLVAPWLAHSAANASGLLATWVLARGGRTEEATLGASDGVPHAVVAG